MNITFYFVSLYPNNNVEMAVLKVSSARGSKFFNLNGIDYQKGLCRIVYGNEEVNSSGQLLDATLRVGLKYIYDNRQEVIQHPIPVTSWYNGAGEQYTSLISLVSDIGFITGSTTRNDLVYDAWGRNKAVIDDSLFHALFSFNVPVSIWYETLNGVEQTFTNATSLNGALNVVAGATLNDKTVLRSFRNLRYEPNRGYLYSSACIFVNKDGLMNRRFGSGNSENGVFFSLESGSLYGVVRTTVNGVTTEDKVLLDTTGIDLSKGNIYDFQFQWRGVGNYRFFINLKDVGGFDYLGTLTKLSMSNPSLPVFFESENLGDNDPMIFGCVDITAEGGKNNGKTYGSISINNQAGEVGITGFNCPVIAIRSKKLIGTLENTRDTLALLASAFNDNRAMFRIWATRDFTAITPNNQAWADFGDGHLEYIVYDVPDVATPMSFDTAKATLIFGSRIPADSTYSTSALFEGRTNIYLTPGDMFVFTIHRDNGAASIGGVTFEFAEEI